MRIVSLLGSTGSIGVNALEIIEKFSDRFVVVGLSAYTNIEKLAMQIDKFLPLIVAVRDEYHAMKLEELIATTLAKPKIVFGDCGYISVATYSKSQVVLNAIVGAAGLLPTLAAIDAGKDIALANKETLVMAGEIVMDKVSKSKINLMPVDSEHSAIYQSLMGNNRADLKNILLTASGGPFLKLPHELFGGITPQEALRHPTWSMGNKITIDSATLMNKTLEIIEARWLFDVPVNHIKVLIHPQSIVHSMVSYKDGTVIGQMSLPEMKAAIAYALSFPERLNLGVGGPDFFKISDLSFQPPDFDRFPCLTLAIVASEIGGAMPAVMNAANEIAVQFFLDGKISFIEIYTVIKRTMDAYRSRTKAYIGDIMYADSWARATAIEITKLPIDK